jgi:hypothetical protein
MRPYLSIEKGREARIDSGGHTQGTRKMVRQDLSFSRCCGFVLRDVTGYRLFKSRRRHFWTHADVKICLSTAFDIIHGHIRPLLGGPLAPRACWPGSQCRGSELLMLGLTCPANLVRIAYKAVWAGINKVLPSLPPKITCRGRSGTSISSISLPAGL